MQTAHTTDPKAKLLPPDGIESAVPASPPAKPSTNEDVEANAAAAAINELIESSIQESASPKCQCNAKYSAFLLIGFIGACAGLVYLTYGHLCAALPECAALFSIEPPWWWFTISGGADYGLMNFILSFNSLTLLSNFVSEEQDTKWKIAKGIIAVGFAILQTMQMVFVASKTVFNAWTDYLIFTLTVAGDFCGKIYASVNLFARDIPYLLLDNFVHYVKDYVVTPIADCCYDTVDAETQKRKHYVNERNVHEERISAKFMTVLRKLPNDVPANKEERLEYLLEQEEDPGYKSQSMITKIINLMIATTFISLSLILASMYAMPSIPLALIFTLGSTYNFIQLPAKALNDIWNGTTNAALGNPVESVLWRKHPYMMLGVNALLLAFSFFSYSTMVMLAAKTYEHAWIKIGFEATLYVTAIAINLVHTVGLNHLFRLGFSKFTKDQNTKNLLALEDEVENKTWYTSKKIEEIAVSGTVEARKSKIKIYDNRSNFWHEKVAAEVERQQRHPEAIQLEQPPRYHQIDATPAATAASPRPA